MEDLMVQWARSANAFLIFVTAIMLFVGLAMVWGEWATWWKQRKDKEK